MDGPGPDRTVDDRRTLLEQSHRLLKADRSEQALVLLDGLAQSYPDGPDILSTRAYCLGRLGRFAEADALCAELDALPEGETWTAPLRTYLCKARLKKPAGDPDSKSIRGNRPPNLPPRQLAKRIESIWATVEQEFETFRAMQKQAESTIAELRETIQEKERFIQEQDGLLDTIQALKDQRDAFESEASNLSAILQETRDEATEFAAEAQKLRETLGAQKVAYAGLEVEHRGEERFNAELGQKLSDSEEQRVAANLEKVQRTALLGRLTDEKQRLAETIADREAEVQAARDLTVASQTELETLRGEKDALAEKCGEANRSIERLNEDLARKQEALDIREQALDRSQGELARVQSEGEALQTQCAALESEAADLEGRLAETQEALGATSVEKADLEQERVELQGRIEALGRLQGEAETAIDGLKRDAAGLSEAKAGLERNIEDLRAEAAAREATQAELTAAIAGLEEHVEAQEVLRAELSVQRDEALTRAADLSTEIEGLNAAWDVATAQADERIAVLLAERDEAAENGRVAANERAAFENMLWETSARLDETSGRERDALAKGESLESQLQQRGDEVGRLEDLRAMLESKVSALEGELAAIIEREAEANARIEGLRDDVAGLEQRGKALEVEKTALVETCDGLRGDLEGAREEKALVEASLEESGEALCEAESRIRILIEENARVQTALVDLRDEFGELTGLKQQSDSRVEALQHAGNELENRLAKTTREREQTQQALARRIEEHEALERREREAARHIEQLEEELDRRKHEIERIVASLTEADSEIDALTGEVTHIEDELDIIRSKELPEALEQKVRAYRETVDLRAQIELLRSQVW